MERYIDADKLFRYVDEQTHLSKGKLQNYIRENHTADVVEVVHGYWIEDIKEIVPLNGIVPIKTLVGYRCSECNRVEFNKEPYCNCGAKMDEGRDT